MVLTRYQIRSEYSLADKTLYQAAKKDDSEALLEGASMAALVGVLRQLGDLTDFAAEVFHCLHNELTITATRGNGLAMRLTQVEAKFSIIEKSILSQTDHSKFFDDPGLDWRCNLQTEENLIVSRNLPRFIMDSYEECGAPPQLFLLDKFDVAGSGSCLKRYSDPSLLKKCCASALIDKSKLCKDTRSRKHVKKVNRDLEVYVKLKRRQLNEAPINSTFGRGYMEKFLNNSERPHDSLDQSCQTKETIVFDTPTDLQTESENLSTLSWQENTLVKPDLLEISSYSKHDDDPQTMFHVDDNESERSILDIQSQDACFSGDGDHDNETNKLENISYHHESVVGVQECMSSEYCIQSHDQVQETPSEIVSTDLMITPVEFLPCRLSIHDTYDTVQGSTEAQLPSPLGGTIETCMHKDDRSDTTKSGTPIAEVSGDRSDTTKSEASLTEGLDYDLRSEVMALEWFNQNLRDHTSSHEELEPPKETKLPQTLPDDKSDGNEITTKISGDKDSLVIGIDRSMLKEVTEQNRTSVRPRVDENDSLLEIIRNKSFNLRPAEASARPNIQAAVPITNLKVAAMLEKANTLRQAMAGNDDDDSDSWSE